MGLANDFLHMCDEFFEQIPNESGDEKLEAAIDSVRNFLEVEVYRWLMIEDVTIASIVRQRIDEVWKRVDPIEKKANRMLLEHYVGIQRFARSFYRKWYQDRAAERFVSWNSRLSGDGGHEGDSEFDYVEEESGRCSCDDENCEDYEEDCE